MAGASPTSAKRPESVPGALRGRRRRRDGHGVGPGGSRPHPAQRHRFLQIAPRECELVAVELHAVDLPDTIPQREPQAVAQHPPPCHLIAELRRAVAADNDVPNLVFGLGLPFAFQTRARTRARVDRLSGEPGSDPEQQEEEAGEERHHGTKIRTPEGGSGWLPQLGGGASGAPGMGARSSVMTATCGSHWRIIRTKVVASSGSNSVPARSSMYDRVFDCGHASRYGRWVRRASYTSHTWTSLLPSWQSRRNRNVG